MIGCLIIHGFGGSVDEVAPLKDFLTGQGLEVLCPTLAGHGQNRKAMRCNNYHHWIESAEVAYSELSQRCDKIWLVGFSMGGLICAHVDLKHGCEGMITMNTPIYHWDLKRIAINLIHDIKTRTAKNICYYLRSSFKMPLQALWNFKRLLIITKPLFAQTKCSLFVAQGLLDDTVQFRSAKFIYDASKSKVKKMKFYSLSSHVICHGEDANELFSDILEFIHNKFEA